MPHHYTAKGSRRYRYYVCDTALRQGAAACPGSRVAAIDLEAFVVDCIRAIGRDPALIAETLAAARREAQRRRPELEAEARRLEQERQRLNQERENLLDAIAESGPAAGTLARRIGETDEIAARVVDRLTEARAELLVTTRDTVDEADLAAALTAFDPVWDELIPREQARVLGLLVQRVTYDAAAAEVAITFHPGGVRDLATRSGRASA
jgi:site-specific DNA recombinase